MRGVRAKQVVALALGLALAVACVGCAGAQSAAAEPVISAPTPAAESSVLLSPEVDGLPNGETSLLEGEAAQPQAEPLALGEDPFGFRFSVAGAVFELPALVSHLMEAGFAPRANLDERFVPGETAGVLFDTGAGLLCAEVANTGSGAVELPSCRVVGVSVGTLAPEAALVDAEGQALVELPGGLTLGAGRGEVLVVCGTPDAPDTAETDPELGYSVGRAARLRFAFGSGVEGFELRSLYPRAQLPERETLPPEVLAYSPPEALGDDPWSYRVRYAGALYTLPAPVVAFLENGWTLRDQGTVAPGEWVSGVSLCLGNQVLRTTLHNFSGEEQPLTGCFVVMVEGSDTSMRVPLELPGGLDGDSSREAVLALLGQPTSTYRDSNAWEHRYDAADGNGRIVARFRPDETEALFDLEVWHSSLP